MKIIFFFLLLSFISITNATAQETYREQYRPQIHFSPKEHWMKPYDKIEINAPEKLLFNNITYTRLKSIWY